MRRRNGEKKMIVLNVTYKCSPELRERFLGAIQAEGLAAASRAEDGNIKYDYYVPAEGGDDLLLIEKWRDAEALAKHMEEPHFRRLGKIKEELGIETEIGKYEAE